MFASWFNIVKAFLVFAWLVPYIYIIFAKLKIFGFISISFYSLEILFIVSTLAATTLFIEWVVAFRTVVRFNNAFSYLKTRNIFKLNSLLDKISIDKCFEKNQTLLQYALDHQMDQDLIFFLLSKGALVTYRASDSYNLNYTLFYMASYYNYIDERLVLYFLNKGADINFIDNSRGFKALSLLQVFVLRCHADIVNTLLNKGADIHYTVPEIEMNTLMLAAKYVSNIPIIEQLINNGADVNTTNINGYDALLFASEFNPDPDIIDAIIKYGAEIKSYKVKGHILRINNVTPLRLAVIGNNIKVIKQLIKLGDNINYKDLYGLSILFIAACHNKDVEVLKLLLSEGANLQKSTDTEGNTPLMGASYLNPNLEVIRYLISVSNNLGRRNQEGFSFIDYLEENNNLKEDERRTLLRQFY